MPSTKPLKIKKSAIWAGAQNTEGPAGLAVRPRVSGEVVTSSRRQCQLIVHNAPRGSIGGELLIKLQATTNLIIISKSDGIGKCLCRRPIVDLTWFDNSGN
jgi:hypothetical protein